MCEDSLDAGTGSACREEPLLRDCVAWQEEENKWRVRGSKGSGFHCASLWSPFSPLV